MLKIRKSSYTAALVGLVVCAALVSGIKPSRGEASSALPQATASATARLTPRVTPSLARRAPSATSPTLGAAASFAILGNLSVSNTGPTIVNGDLGISGNPVTSITGFPPGIVTGAMHAGDPVAVSAQAANTAAFGALNAGANADANCIAPYLFGANRDLTGANLVAGVYCADNFTCRERSLSVGQASGFSSQRAP